MPDSTMTSLPPIPDILILVGRWCDNATRARIRSTGRLGGVVDRPVAVRNLKDFLKDGLLAEDTPTNRRKFVSAMQSHRGSDLRDETWRMLRCMQKWVDKVDGEGDEENRRIELVAWILDVLEVNAELGNGDTPSDMFKWDAFMNGPEGAGYNYFGERPVCAEHWWEQALWYHRKVYRMNDLQIADEIDEAVSEFDEDCPKRGCFSIYTHTDCAPCNIKLEIGELRGTYYWDDVSDSSEEEDEQDSESEDDASDYVTCDEEEGETSDYVTCDESPM